MTIKEEIKRIIGKQKWLPDSLPNDDDEVIDDLVEFSKSEYQRGVEEERKEVFKIIKKEWNWAKENGAPESNFEMILNMLEPIKLHSQTNSSEKKI